MVGWLFVGLGLGCLGFMLFDCFGFCLGLVWFGLVWCLNLVIYCFVLPCCGCLFVCFDDCLNWVWVWFVVFWVY